MGEVLTEYVCFFEYVVLGHCFAKIRNGLKKLAERGTCRLYGEANNLW